MSLSENNLLAKVGIDATVLLSTATGLLYLAGFYRHVGYLQKWGVESDLLANDIYSTLSSGYLLLSSTIMQLSIIAIGSGIIAVIYIPILTEALRSRIADKVANWWHRKDKDEKKEKLEDEPPKLSINIMAVVFKLIAISLFLFIVLYAFNRLLIFSYEKGEKHAVEEYKQYSQSNAQGDQKSLFSKLQTYCIDGAQRNALLLATDRSTYALYFPKTKAAQESVEIIVSSRITCIKATKNTTP